MLHKILTKLAQTNTQLVAVSKKRTEAAVLEMYQQGQRIFGENRVQELLTKYKALPSDIEWHLIGHLQSNKVKYIAPFIHTIHSVNNEKVLLEINQQAKKHNRIINCLLQIKIGEEESKFGFDIDELRLLLAKESIINLANIRFCGVMGMATFTENEAQIRHEFQALKYFFDELKNHYFSENTHFKEISMGMSGDYEIAIEEGSTLVRIGSLLFN